MNRRVRLAAITGVLVLVATCVVYTIAQPDRGLSTALGFAFLLYAEIAFFGGIIAIEYWAKHSSEVMSRAGIGTCVFGYAAVVFISSVLYMQSHSDSAKGFLITQVVLLAVASVVTLIIAAASRRAKEHDQKTLNADAMAKDFIEKLSLLKELTGQTAEFDKLIDDLKYSDTSKIVDADVELDAEIDELERIIQSASDADQEEIKKRMDKIDFLIKKRKLQTKNKSRGGI